MLSMRQVAQQEIEKLARALRDEDPTLPPWAAREKVRVTKRGRELMTLYNDPDSRFSVRECVARKARRLEAETASEKIQGKAWEIQEAHPDWFIQKCRVEARRLLPDVAAQEHA